MKPTKDPAAEPTVDSLRFDADKPGPMADAVAAHEARVGARPTPMSPDAANRTRPLQSGHMRNSPGNDPNAAGPRMPTGHGSLDPDDFTRGYLSDERHSRQSPGNTRGDVQAPVASAPFVGSQPGQATKVDTAALWQRLEAARRP